ncbi:MAG TPA: bifunctional folylpolyglutamate synthase/dihydrofolate synthase, partial [Magnetococcales bacterium]|nr:bifunctional folylpolyglutamate synthase/dihydrofolate synthase [Magnetococcales bacterium]
TSPHLVRFNERIRIQGREVADASIAEALLRVHETSEGIPATWFEKITVAAFWLFVQHGLGATGARPALVLLETGMGGRLDATNVVVPLLSLITAIGLDHMEYLGTDMESIAWEKGGILKSQVPAITSCPSGVVQDVLVRQARNIGAPLLLPGRDYRFHITGKDGCWEFEDTQGGLSLPPPGLAGAHQYENAALAVAALRQLAPWPVSPSAMAAGLTQVYWPGRLEYVAGAPSALIDGAHNPLGMTVLARALAEDDHSPPLRTLIFSALDDKDLHSMVQHLAPWVGHVVVLPVGGQRGYELPVLEACWQNQGKTVFKVVNFQDAWKQAMAVTPPHGQLLITGSLYLVGEARSFLDRPRPIEAHV